MALLIKIPKEVLERILTPIAIDSGGLTFCNESPDFLFGFLHG